MNITVQSAELAPHLRIDRQAGKVIVTWEGSYVLLVTQDLKSPFEPILNAKSPFSPDMVDGMFYALGRQNNKMHPPRLKFWGVSHKMLFANGLLRMPCLMFRFSTVFTGRISWPSSLGLLSQSATQTAPDSMAELGKDVSN